MKLLRRHAMPWLLAMSAVALLQGCSSAIINVAPMPPVKYEKLAHVEATACGALFGPLIPLGLNGRVKEARDMALAKAPGATSLINVDMKEEWAWVFIIVSRCTTISGDAVKEVI
ncbi:MAG: hypothetical protein JWL63_1161 [Rhodocyclales bacterium]|nr:hypothetical protein [Rhodocyclales bacterium]